MQDFLKSFTLSEVINSDPMSKMITFLMTAKQEESPNNQDKLIIVLRKTDFKEDINPNNLDLSELIHQNDCFYKYHAKFNENVDKHDSQIEVEIVYPVTDFLLMKYTATNVFNIVETQDVYLKHRVPIINKQKKKLGWIYNIFDGSKEQDKVLFQDSDFCVVYDYKYNPKIHSLDRFHLLVIFKDNDLNSLRDVDGKHVQLLHRAQNRIHEIVRSSNLSENGCLTYFHYPPTFYQLHLHVVASNNKLSDSKSDRAHILQNVLYNIHLKHDYYQKADIVIRLNQSEHKEMTSE